jgi:Acyclic terpene utilisation family protein AtuA
VSKTIRIGGACGFWGDSAIALPQLLREPLDYLTFDFLAEITMSIMARARAKDPRAGYAMDFVDMIGRHSAHLAARNVKVIANAGGVNPLSCARALELRLAEAGVPLKVAAIVGDDVLDRATRWRAEGRREMFTGALIPEELLSLNVYLGAEPIAAALAAGADIVVTGRCVDSALTLGACLHEFGWGRQDLHCLAGGSLAGHIVECGAQATGGIHTDWEKTGDWANIGYPIVEVTEDGSFTLSKPRNTGGLVSIGTAAEQMVYEIGDPAAYVLPDVVCDFTQVEIREAGSDRVHFSGARGYPPTPTYKASATWSDGFRVGAYYMIAGIDAAAKADKVADAVFRRTAEMLREEHLPPFTEISHEAIGSETTYGPASRARGTREVMLKLAAKNSSPRALEILVREFTSAGTSMAPGFTGLGGNRPKVMPVVRLSSLLVPKDEVNVLVKVGETSVPLADACGCTANAALVPRQLPETVTETPLAPTTEFVPLIRLAWARSGDKGNLANIGVIARRPQYLPYIRAALTPQAVSTVFAHYLQGSVERFDLPGSYAINILLHDVLGGGGTASLRNDPQGKAYAQMLLGHPIPIPADLLQE